MSEKKHQNPNKTIFDECKDITSSVFRALECPVCFEPTDIPLMCQNGHFVCESCHSKIGNSCPTCKGKYMDDNKCYAVQGITEQLKRLNISLDTLDGKYEGPSKLITQYRDLIRNVLQRTSKLLTEVQGTFVSLSKGGDAKMQSHFDEKTKGVVQKLNDFCYFMKETEDDLINLKKQI